LWRDAASQLWVARATRPSRRATGPEEGRVITRRTVGVSNGVWNVQGRLDKNEYIRIKAWECGCIYFSSAAGCVEKKVFGRQKLAVSFGFFIPGVLLEL